MKITLAAIPLFLAPTLAMALPVGRCGFSLAGLRGLFGALSPGGALIADGPVSKAVTAPGICDLYGLRPDLFEKITNIYGKHNGMAC